MKLAKLFRQVGRAGWGLRFGSNLAQHQRRRQQPQHNRNLHHHALIVAASLLAVQAVSGATFTWTGAISPSTGNLLNWSPSTSVPGIGDVAIFNGTGNVFCTNDISPWTLDSLIISNGFTTNLVFDSTTIIVSNLFQRRDGRLSWSNAALQVHNRHEQFASPTNLITKGFTYTQPSGTISNSNSVGTWTADIVRLGASNQTVRIEAGNVWAISQFAPLGGTTDLSAAASFGVARCGHQGLTTEVNVANTDYVAADLGSVVTGQGNFYLYPFPTNNVYEWGAMLDSSRIRVTSNIAFIVDLEGQAGHLTNHPIVRYRNTTMELARFITGEGDGANIGYRSDFSNMVLNVNSTATGWGLRGGRDNQLWFWDSVVNVIGAGLSWNAPSNTVWGATNTTFNIRSGLGNSATLGLNASFLFYNTQIIHSNISGSQISAIAAVLPAGTIAVGNLSTQTLQTAQVWFWTLATNIFPTIVIEAGTTRLQSYMLADTVIHNGGTFTAGSLTAATSGLHVTNFIIAGGTIRWSNLTHRVAGDLTQTGGTVLPETGTIVLHGPRAASLSVSNHTNLIISNAAGKIVSLSTGKTHRVTGQFATSGGPAILQGNAGTASLIVSNPAPMLELVAQNITVAATNAVTVLQLGVNATGPLRPIRRTQ